MTDWKTFDEMPENPDIDVFVTDFSTVHVQKWVEAELYSGFAKSGMRWDYIDYPDVPVKKKSLHECEMPNIHCAEVSNGDLVVMIKGTPSSNFVKCNFCPVCGYSKSSD